MEFKNLVKNEGLLKALTENNIIVPTEIQNKAIPIGLEGKDILAKSQTGTGKTLAFMLPILERIKTENHVQALIICPTRELSIQVFNEIKKYIKYFEDISTLAVYGGQRIDEQIKQLRKKPQIIVATPGRLIDHLQRRTIRLSEVETVVLDEADEMISIGFKEELETILEYLPKARQTLFFSATFPSKVKTLAKNYLNNPVQIEQKVKHETVSAIDQYYIEMRDSDKIEVVKRLIMKHNLLSIVFCNTKKKVDQVVLELQQAGIIAEALHGDLSQQMRDNVMKKLRKGILQVLVATDVAARGIDVENIGVVYNLDLPDDFEYYVHRIGRTGRAGKTGISYAFSTRKQHHRMEQLMRMTKADIKKISIPSVEEVNNSRIKQYLHGLVYDIESNNIFDELLDQGITYEQIAHSIIKDRFPIEDFTEIKNKRRESRKKREKVQISAITKDSVRVFISAGRKDGIKIKHILGAFRSEAHISKNEIRDIEIMKEFTFVSVPKNKLSRCFKVKHINDTKVSVELANKK